jgi:hypothetical protein
MTERHQERPNPFDLIGVPAHARDLQLHPVPGSGLSPVDGLEGQPRCSIRKRVTSTDPYIELNTEDGGITLGGALGTILLEISAEDTAALSWRGNAVYDLELTPANGATTRLLQGTVTFSPEVTRPVPVTP